MDKLEGQEYSAPTTVGTVGATAFTVTETKLVFDIVDGLITAPEIGGLGGNEHDQDVGTVQPSGDFGNEVTAP